jgi:hypothetical protein
LAGTFNVNEVKLLVPDGAPVNETLVSAVPEDPLVHDVVDAVVIQFPAESRPRIHRVTVPVASDETSTLEVVPAATEEL